MEAKVRFNGKDSVEEIGALSIIPGDKVVTRTNVSEYNTQVKKVITPERALEIFGQTDFDLFNSLCNKLILEGVNQVYPEDPIYTEEDLVGEVLSVQPPSEQEPTEA
jgi:hypothetical protein